MPQHIWPALESLTVSILTPDGPSGDSLKDAALAMLEKHRAQLIRRSRRALLTHLLEQGSGTIDDVRAVVPTPPNIDPTAFGAVPKSLKREGIIRADGFRKTRRPDSHARLVNIWVLADAEAAKEWLRTHPELPDADAEVNP
jgi:hypothetical protein